MIDKNFIFLFFDLWMKFTLCFATGLYKTNQHEASPLVYWDDHWVTHQQRIDSFIVNALERIHSWSNVIMNLKTFGLVFAWDTNWSCLHAFSFIIEWVLSRSRVNFNPATGYTYNRPLSHTDRNRSDAELGGISVHWVVTTFVNSVSPYVIHKWLCRTFVSVQLYINRRFIAYVCYNYDHAEC